MHPDSPHYQFDPGSIGWLHRKVRTKGEYITAADLARIANADRGVFADAIFQEQVLLALAGRLPTRRGRGPEDPKVGIKVQMAAVLIEDRAAEIRAERKASGIRDTREPRIQAAEEAAHFLQLHMCAAALLNRISARKKA